MLPATALLLPLLSAPATAGTIRVENTSGEKVHAWIDGQRAGRVRPGEVLAVSTDGGLHEVALSPYRDPLLLSCLGQVDVYPADATITVDGGDCDSLITVGLSDPSISRGTDTRLTFSQALPLWLSVDDRKPIQLMQPGLILNVSPGDHTIRYAAGRRGVWQQGSVTLLADAPVTIACDADGCEEEYITERDAAIALGVSTEEPAEVPPPPERDLGTPDNLPTVEVALVSSAATGPDADHFCCVQEAFYGCPSAAAVLACVGTSASCQESCAGDLSCLQQCAGTAEADVSQCQRVPTRDASCR